jgi:hypothetical protein
MTMNCSVKTRLKRIGYVGEGDDYPDLRQVTSITKLTSAEVERKEGSIDTKEEMVLQNRTI